MLKVNRRDFLGLAGSCAALLPSSLNGLSAPIAGSEEPAPQGGTANSWIVSPFNVENKAQLFVDKVLIRETNGVSFTLHPGQKDAANPLIKVDRPWEGWRIVLYGTVLYDEEEKVFKMWYGADRSDYFSNYPALYATSHDGIHWQKPLVGTIPCSKAKRHNAILDSCLLPSVIKDTADPDPTCRYKMICWIEKKRADGGGYRTFISPDGLHWTLLSKTPICPGADVITGYYDNTRRLFVAFPKIMTRVRGHMRRVFYLITSADFQNWSEPELVWSPDLRDDAGSLGRIARARALLDVPDDPALMRTEFYGIGAYQHESCALAFPWIFTINNNARYGNQEGQFELQLGVSRDLKQWHRPFRVSCVHNGALGEWDCGLLTTPAQALRVGDEIWLYYGGANYTHGTPAIYRAEGTGRGTKYTGSIGLAKWKLDRFVSADSPAEGGTLTTVPIVFSGSNLEINANIKPGGSMLVHILDPAGKPIEGWEPSTALHGDSLRHNVTWPGGMNLSSLKSKPVTLQFDLKDAELYSFAFRDSPNRSVF